jgi:hypothetical protein
MPVMTTHRGTEAVRNSFVYLGASVSRCVVIVTVIAAVILAGGCGPSEPLKASTIQVGRSLNSDDSINAHTTTFKPNETIYVSVINEAAGKGTIAVRWVYNGQTISEESRDVSYTREGATAFHLQSPSAGFPEGEYRVEIQIDGQPAGARDFRVAK